MDINDILDSLGLDLSDPETKRGAMEAIEAILNSRVPDSSDDIVGGGGASNEVTEIELDPDLIQPSKKHTSDMEDSDVEIEDEEDILSQIKLNDSEDDLDLDVQSNQGDSESGGDTTSKTSNEPSEDTSSQNDDDPTESESDSEKSEEPEKLKNTEMTPEFSSEETSEENSEESSEEDSEEATSDKNEKSNHTEEPDKDETEDPNSAPEATSEENESDENIQDTEETADSEESTEPEDGFDEEDLLDDELKDLYKDEEITAKQESRKIKRERTLQAAKETLAKAKANKVAPALIRELEKSIVALEELTEATKKSLKDMSDEEFNLIINRVFDAIDAIGNSGLTYTTDKERELQAQEIKKDLSDSSTQAELSAEDAAHLRAENQAIKARERETDKFKRKARGSFKGFQDFLNSLYRTIALQVHTNEVQDDSWSAINRRHSGTSVLQPGKRIQELPDKKIPVIDFYFDQSGSWSESDLKVGEEAVSRLADMEEKGQIKINIYYFANEVHTDAASARWEGGTMAWNEIVKNIVTTQATNVIIMTDSDMEDRWGGYWSGEKALSYTVPGYVWYLWRDGENAPRLPRDLKGRGGTQQFSFSS